MEPSRSSNKTRIRLRFKKRRPPWRTIGFLLSLLVLSCVMLTLLIVHLLTPRKAPRPDPPVNCSNPEYLVTTTPWNESSSENHTCNNNTTTTPVPTSNPNETTKAHWIIHRSSAVTISESNKVSCCKPTPDCGNSSFNALWKDGGIQDQQMVYWEVQIFEGRDMHIGLTDESKFAEGCGSKGLMYGGRWGYLSGGGDPLVSAFGPGLQAGDTIGVLGEVDQSCIKIYFYVNGNPLGMGFEVPRETLGDAIYPLISFSETGGSASIKQSKGTPVTLTRPKGFWGHWQYQSGLKFPFFTRKRITLDIIHETSNQYFAAFRIRNIIGASITRDGLTGPWEGECVLYSLKVKDPEIEYPLRHHTDGGIFELNGEGNKLTIKNGNEVSVWSRIGGVIGVKPVTWNPFKTHVSFLSKNETLIMEVLTLRG